MLQFDYININKHTAYATQFLNIHLPLTLLAANGDEICTEKDFAPVLITGCTVSEDILLT